MKIKPQDLRIGNVLTYISEEGPMYCRVDVQDLQWLCDNPKDFNEKHQVVELTEELLIKLGHKKNGKGFYDNGTYDFGYFKDGKFIFNFRFNNTGWIESEILELHDYQNLCHSLTVTELNVSELFTS